MARPDPQRAEDAATILPFALAALLAPPAILIFAAPVALAGIPLILVYLFGIWAAAIVIALVLARRIGEAGTATGQDRPPPETQG